MWVHAPPPPPRMRAHAYIYTAVTYTKLAKVRERKEEGKVNECCQEKEPPSYSLKAQSSK